MSERPLHINDALLAGATVVLVEDEENPKMVRVAGVRLRELPGRELPSRQIPSRQLPSRELPTRKVSDDLPDLDLPSKVPTTSRPTNSQKECVVISSSDIQKAKALLTQHQERKAARRDAILRIPYAAPVAEL